MTDLFLLTLNHQSVSDVIRQLCLNLKVQEPPLLFALRDDQDELVTDDNLRRIIRDKANLKLVLHVQRSLRF